MKAKFAVQVCRRLKVRLDGQSKLHIAGNIIRQYCRQHETIGNNFGHYSSAIIAAIYRGDVPFRRQ